MKRKEKVNYWSFPKYSLDFGSSLERVIATTLVFLPEESRGQRSLEGYSPWGNTELDMTDMNQPAYRKEQNLKDPWWFNG